MTFALEGLRVLDMTVFQQGTYASAMLADMGADVIKIEGPDSPDLGRWSVAVEAQKPLNSYFQTLNRNKRGIVLDLKLEKGRQVFHRLAEEADVFVSNLRRPALARIGADYETLSRINPAIIYGRASGYGPFGPDADLASMDILGQARGGLMSRTGDPDGPPRPAGAPIADHVGAISLAFGIVVALYHRERTGEGQQVDGSLLGGQICIQSHNITDYLWSGRVLHRRARVGNNPTWSTYKGSDGKWFVIGMNRQHYWAPFCRTIGRPEWVDAEEYATLDARLANHEKLFAELDAMFAAQPADYWVKLFSGADLLATHVNDYADLAEDPQAIANGYITEIQRGDGAPPLRMVGPPVILSKTPARIRHLAPEFGEHTEEVLLQAGFEWPEIEELRTAGAIGPRQQVEAAGG